MSSSTANSLPRARPALQWAAVILALLLPSLLLAEVPQETDVEAAYLFDFGKFMHAPPHGSSEFRIGIMGRNPFGGTLDQLTAKETLDGRPMRVVRVSSIEEARVCDILFVGESEDSGVDHILSTLTGSPVLTVSRIPDFLQRGGMIQFVVVQNHVRFEVNLAAAKDSHIQLSSELLRVAAQVMDEEPSGERR